MHDPTWPLCVFDVRGACKDGGCPKQHLKDGMLPGALACAELRARMTALKMQVGRFVLLDLKCIACTCGGTQDAGGHAVVCCCCSQFLTS